MTKKIILLVGIPGSGKTTYSKKWVEEDPENRVRFNNDEVNNMISPCWCRNKQDIIDQMRQIFISTSISKGYDIILDNTNLNMKDKEYCEKMITIHNDLVKVLKNEGKLNPEDDIEYKLEYVCLDTPLEECIRRDLLREKPIGEKVIKEMYEKYRRLVGNDCQGIYQ